jgi:hypothetical protein
MDVEGLALCRASPEGSGVVGLLDCERLSVPTELRLIVRWSLSWRLRAGRRVLAVPGRPLDILDGGWLVERSTKEFRVDVEVCGVEHPSLISPC